MGSVFSPYYAWARRRSGCATADPHDHCAMNVALYTPGGNRWAMTERGRGQLQRNASSLCIGRSSMAWKGDMLEIVVDEVTSPVPSRVRGTIRVHPAALARESYALDGAGRHRWHPIAPCARVEVELTAPSLAWRGHGYADSNFGERALERDFTSWDWSRAAIGGDESAVFYDVARREAEPLALALRFGADGSAEAFDPPPRAALPTTRWRMPRVARSEAAHEPRIARTLESAPFYTRSVIEARQLGRPVTAMHESLSLERLDTLGCRCMLPFRMPRWCR